MVIAYDEATLRDYVRRAEELQRAFPILVDRFLENATEVDVDALCDGEDVVVAGIMEHIEQAGIHSGDSSCVLPAVQIPEAQHRILSEYTVTLARQLGVVGLMNVQYAIQNGTVYVLEVNPSGRTRTITPGRPSFSPAYRRTASPSMITAPHTLHGRAEARRSRPFARCMPAGAPRCRSDRRAAQ